MEAFAEGNSQLFTREQGKQDANFYTKTMEVRDGHNKKLNQWTKVAGELSEIEKEVQFAQLEFQKKNLQLPSHDRVALSRKRRGR